MIWSKMPTIIIVAVCICSLPSVGISQKHAREQRLPNVPELENNPSAVRYQVKNTDDENFFALQNFTDELPLLKKEEQPPLFGDFSELHFTTKVRIFSDTKRKGGGLGDLFIKSITIRLLEKQPWFQSEFLDDDAAESKTESSMSCRKALDDQEIEDDISLKRRVILTAAGSALKEVMETTHVGKRIKQVEEKCASLFLIEYSKTKTEEGSFYLPGQKSIKDSEEPKDFKVTIRSMVYASAISLKGEFPIEMEVDYFKTKSIADYDFNERALNISVQNNMINQMTGFQTILFQKVDLDGEFAGFLKFQIEF